MLTIVYSSHKGKDHDNAFNEHISKTIGTSHRIVGYENMNEFSLTEVYNKLLEPNYPNPIIFIHNDIKFKAHGWGKVIERIFSATDYGIIGLAGTTQIPASGMWWEDSTKMVGIVNHTDGIKEWTSTYSPPFRGVKRVAAIDGVFIAVNPSKLMYGFNEDFKGFHFYDLSFSIENALAEVKIGVTTDIRIVHSSVGMVNAQWESNKAQFVEMFNQYLPFSIKQSI